MRLSKVRRMVLGWAGTAALVLGFSGPAQAHADNIYWSIGMSSPGVSIGVGNAPPVAVYPAPVYVPSYPVVVAPRPVYYGPPPFYYGGRPGWHRGHGWRGEREGREWREGREGYERYERDEGRRGGW